MSSLNAILIASWKVGGITAQLINFLLDAKLRVVVARSRSFPQQCDKAAQGVPANFDFTSMSLTSMPPSLDLDRERRRFGSCVGGRL